MDDENLVQQNSNFLKKLQSPRSTYNDISQFQKTNLQNWCLEEDIALQRGFSNFSGKRDLGHCESILGKEGEIWNLTVNNRPGTNTDSPPYGYSKQIRSQRQNKAMSVSFQKNGYGNNE